MRPCPSPRRSTRTSASSTATTSWRRGPAPTSTTGLTTTESEAGDQQFITRLAQDETRQFVWHLLQADAVADPGASPAADHPDPASALAELATELESILPLPKDVVGRQLRKLAGRGLIVPAVQDGAAAWQWRNSLAAHPSQQGDEEPLRPSP